MVLYSVFHNCTGSDIHITVLLRYASKVYISRVLTGVQKLMYCQTRYGLVTHLSGIRHMHATYNSKQTKTNVSGRRIFTFRARESLHCTYDKAWYRQQVRRIPCAKNAGSCIT
jgi:hypothetical protein